MAIIPDLCKMIVGSGEGMCKNDINNNAIAFFVQGLWDDSLEFDPQKKGLRLCLTIRSIKTVTFFCVFLGYFFHLTFSVFVINSLPS